MFAMLCVVISSSTFNFLSNRFSWVTSSTHATIGALIGVGVASGAGVEWGYVVTTKNGQVSGQNGLGAVVASFFISPVLAGLIGAIVYSIVKYCILEQGKERSYKLALISAPIWYAVVAAFEAWLISWKSPRYTVTDDQTLGIFFGTLGVVGVVTYLFLVPLIRRKVWQGWYNLSIVHLPLMILSDATLEKSYPKLCERPYYFDDRHLKGEEIPDDEAWQWTEKDLQQLAKQRGILPPVAVNSASIMVESDPIKVSPDEQHPSKTHPKLYDPEYPDLALFNDDGLAKSQWTLRKEKFKLDMKNPNLSPLKKIQKVITFVFFIGVDRDIADYKTETEEVTVLHDRAKRYYGKTENVFRYLQVLTSSVASFAHGANDVALSVGPISTMFYYWNNGGRGSPPKSSIVLDWQLAVGAVCLVLGLWFYGYNIMRALGNRLTYHSPSRGFSMELGAAITVLIAARNGIPVSTTNCIVGATVGVGLMNGDYKSINWKLFFFTFFTWCYTVPFCAILSGSIYAFASYAPDIGCKPYTVSSNGGLATVNGVTFNGTQKFYPFGC